MREVPPFLIVVILLFPVMPRVSISVHSASSFGTANQPLQVWFDFPQTITSGPCAYSLEVYAKTSTDLTITNLHWDFGDGSTLDVPHSAQSYVSDTRSHIYESTGTYSVTVTAYDNTGNSGTASVTLPNVHPGSCTVRQQSDPNPTCESVVNPTSASSYILPLENGVAQPNLWGLNSATGSVEQCYGTNGLQTSIQLSAINSKVPYPLGYTEVIYGNNLYDQAVTSGSANQLGFPSLLSTFDTVDLWATTKYAISTPAPTGMPYRLFYDLWLEQNPSSGKSPSSADFEVGITFAYTPLNPLEFPFPISTLSNEPIIVNGQTETSKWNLYKALMSGSPAPFYDFFLASPSQQPNGTISIRLQDFIDCFGRYLSSPENYLMNLFGRHSLSGYRLMGVELGTEFAGGAWELMEPSNIQLNWEWTLSSYSLSTTSSTIILVTSQAQSMQTSTSVGCVPSSVAVSSPRTAQLRLLVLLPQAYNGNVHSRSLESTWSAACR